MKEFKTCDKCSPNVFVEFRAHKHKNGGFHKFRCVGCSRAKDIRISKELRFLVLRTYSPDLKCCLCLESNVEFLVIDHVSGNGANHRREIGEGSGVLYKWLKKNKFPPGFRVLCYNCNFEYRIPHIPIRKFRELSSYSKKIALRVKKLLTILSGINVKKLITKEN
jgi:hypothetical protein